MLFLVLAILGGSMLSIVMRMSEGRIQSKSTMLAVNYITCMLLCGCYMNFDLSIGTEKSGLTLLLGMITGVFYVLSLIVMQSSIRKNGVILSSVFSRLGGLLVPLFAAICLFGEKPTLLQLIGAVIACLSIVAINAGSSRSSVQSVTLLFGLLALDGCATTMSTVYEQLGSRALGTQFLFYTFSTAFLICIVLILRSKERFGLKEILFGLGIGIPNFYASRCLLQALQSIDAVIVYPTRGVASLLLITLIGVLFFKEHLRKRQWAAMAAILVSVVLLNITPKG